MKAKNSSKNQDYMQQVTTRETEILLQELTKTLKHNIPGDVVEFGCYKADTSVLYQKLLESMGHGSPIQSENQAVQASQKMLWLYDSFEGLPAKTREDNSAAGDAFQAGELLVTKREVIEKFKNNGGLFISVLTNPFLMILISYMIYRKKFPMPFWTAICINPSKPACVSLLKKCRKVA